MSLPDQIREAVAAGDLAGAARRFEDHTSRVCDAIRARTCDPAAIEECRELLALALASRAHLQHRLQEIRRRVYVTSAYSS